MGSDRLHATTIAFEGGKGKAGISTEELAELEAEHKSAQQDYTFAVAEREQAQVQAQAPGHVDAANSMTTVTIVMVAVGAVSLLAGTAFFMLKVVVPKFSKSSPPVPPLGSKHVAVALESGDGKERSKQ